MFFEEDMLILRLKRKICSLWVTHLCIITRNKKKCRTEWDKSDDDFRRSYYISSTSRCINQQAIQRRNQKKVQRVLYRKYRSKSFTKTNNRLSREIWYSENSSAMISKSFKKAGVTLNLDGSEDELFIGYCKEDDGEEMVREVSQTPND